MIILNPSAYYEPENYSSRHLNNDLETAIAKAGYKIRIVTPQPTRGCTVKDRREFKRKEQRLNGAIIVQRFKMIPESKRTIIRAIRYLLINFVEYIICLKMKDVDLIYAGSTPPTQGVLAVLLKKALKVPFIYNLQDIFPDSMVNAKMTRKGSIIWKIGRKIEDFTYKNADAIIVISEGFKENILVKGVPKEKIHIIPNWVNTDHVFPIPRKDNEMFVKYPLDPNEFYLTYCGNIGFSQNMDLLIDVAKEIKSKLTDVQFVLIGEGVAKHYVQQRIEKENIDNITMLPFQEYEKIAHVFSLGDAGMIISKKGIGGSSVPSKTWSIMAAEKPVLASFDTDSALSKLISSVHAGIAVEADQKQELLDAIVQLYKDVDNRSQMGKNGKKYLDEFLNKEISLNKYIELFKQIYEEGKLNQ